MTYEKERRALMRRIWKLNVSSEEGRFRLQRYGYPWLVENYYDPALVHIGNDLRIKFESHRRVDQLPLWERVQRFRQSVPWLFHEARLAWAKGMSYRDFKVGTSLLAFKAGQEHEKSWGIFSGMNTKHAPNMRPTCSEPIAINAAYAENYSVVLGMVVVGELREEDIGHIATLHPCKDCRWFMHGHPMVDSHTLVLTTSPNYWGFGYYKDEFPRSRMYRRFGKEYEIHTVGQLLRKHQKISGDDFE
jgi:cytidine deaminase